MGSATRPTGLPPDPSPHPSSLLCPHVVGREPEVESCHPGALGHTQASEAFCLGPADLDWSRPPKHRRDFTATETSGVSLWTRLVALSSRCLVAPSGWVGVSATSFGEGLCVPDPSVLAAWGVSAQPPRVAYVRFHLPAIGTCVRGPRGQGVHAGTPTLQAALLRRDADVAVTLNHGPRCCFSELFLVPSGDSQGTRETLVPSLDEQVGKRPVWEG